MSTENIIILAIAIVLAFVVIRFLTKILAKLIAIAIVIALIVFVLFYWNGGILSMGKDQFIIYDLEEKYCEEEMDTTKCNCIVLPLKADIENQYTAEELAALEGNRKESLEILMNSIRDNSSNIKECLRENNDGKAWKEFTDDLKGSWLNRQVEKWFGDDEEEEVPVEI
jgi:hypothetical protein